MHPVLRLGILVCALGSVEGRKKLQKMVHILQVAGAPFPERFELSHFGAYSSELKAEIDAMCSEDLLSEKPVQSGFKTYVIKPGKALKSLFTELGVRTNEPWVELAKKLNGETAQTLEGISTVLYLKERKWNGDSLRARFVALKPHLSRDFDSFVQKAETYAAA